MSGLLVLIIINTIDVRRAAAVVFAQTHKTLNIHSGSRSCINCQL